MPVYIYKGEILSICLSVTLLIRLGLSTSPYQLPDIKNHSHMAQSVVQLTCIQEVAGPNPGGEQIFFEYQYFCKHIF